MELEFADKPVVGKPVDTPAASATPESGHRESPRAHGRGMLPGRLARRPPHVDVHLDRKNSSRVMVCPSRVPRFPTAHSESGKKKEDSRSIGSGSRPGWGRTEEEEEE